MAHSLSVNHCSNYTMTLTGKGQVTATPDLAVIRLGVETTGYNPPQIQLENAQISQRVIQAVSQYEIKDIKTVQYLIDKKYEYQDGNQIDQGYSVRHILEIKISNIDEVGEIIDTAVNMGANIVESVSFELAEPEIYYQHALNLAINQAMEKARSVSTNIHIQLNPIPIRIIEDSAAPVPMMGFQRADTTTPIVPGELRIEASVTADFSYAC